jgi:hypothetical protein
MKYDPAILNILDRSRMMECSTLDVDTADALDAVAGPV